MPRRNPARDAFLAVHGVKPPTLAEPPQPDVDLPGEVATDPVEDLRRWRESQPADRRKPARRATPGFLVHELAEAFTPVRGHQDVLRIPFLRALAKYDRECFCVVYLNARHEPTAVGVVSVGSMNASIVHPREVFRGAIVAGAASIILLHNHPSGDPEPSEEDLGITRRLSEVGELCGIGVLDHIITAARGSVSFRERKLL